MKLRLSPVPGSAPRAELLFALAHEGATPQALPPLQRSLADCQASGDLSGEFRATSVFHLQLGTARKDRALPRRLGFVGMGKAKEVSTERLRQAAALAQQRAEAHKVDTLHLLVRDEDHKGLSGEAAGTAVAEGLILGAYRYEKPSKTKPKPRHAQKAEVCYAGRSFQAFSAGFALGIAGAEATCFARDLENRAGNHCTPSDLAREARKLAGRRVRVRILERKDMERLGMGALLGVARGSVQPPKLIVLDYNPAGAKDTVCVVGKGLTFDTGGISIKPSGKMDEMRMDMCGGGAVLGLFHALGKGGLDGARDKTRIVGVIPASENMPDGDAQKPGDVVTACDGTTIEVLNTDAEGRLILADALAYAKKTYEPSRIVDLATLTGAVIVALGHEAAAVIGTDRSLVHALQDAGKAADEPLWELPLWEPHREQMKSKYADLQNINAPGAGNGTIAGAAFLSFFVEGTAWAHLDIAGTAWDQRARDYYRGGAAGTAVRTLLHWARGL
ncbi:MAG: leucyl aminopeptidase [Planctomycetes bacterium]|nr:leucyl aminopeptidase [Planctomycetota bacterium]